MKSPHLFGIDLDGTLLNPKGDVADRTRAAIHALLDAGHKVCFSTGRNGIEAAGVFASVGHEAISVLVSGAMVVDMRDGRVLYRGHMHADLAADLCSVIEDVGQASVAFTDRAETGVDYYVSGDKPLHRALGFWLAMSGQRVERVPTLKTLDHGHTLRVSCVTDYAAAAKVRTAVADRIGSRAYIHSIVVASEEAEIIELFDPTVNKWQGLLRVAAEYGISPGNIIAVGDDTNDLPMIKNAGLGLAMGNAREEVKAVARQVIGRNEDDGLAAFIESWLAD
ncbi:MAG: HAD family hydrolase [Tepidisphaeraceae bacterium]